MRKVTKLIFCLCLLAVCLLPLSSCSNDPVSSLKLDVDFEGKSFHTDGIGEVELLSVTDGDTANYQDHDNTFITLRYFAVDTPESTGEVQKWGRAASEYAKEKLENAVSIVLEKDPSSTELDNYGRYLGYVWYKPTEDSDYINFNLELVQNGFSQNTSKGSGKYLDYFNDAQAYAEENNLRIWSDDDDPLYSDTPEVIENIKILTERQEELYYKMISIEAYVKNYSNSYLTIANMVDGVEYTYTVYMHNTTAPTITRPGNLVNIIGTVQTYNGNWQISGVRYGQIDGNNSTLVTAGYYLTFGKSINLVAPYYNFENITVANVEISGENYVFTGTTARLRQSGEVTVTFTVPNSKEINFTDYIGKEIEVVGFNEEGTTSSDMQINFVVLSLDDIIVH